MGPSPTYSYSAAVVETEVDPETGMLRVEHVWIAYDVGQCINPVLVMGQVEGTGVRIDQVPIHPHMIVKALERQAKGEEARYGPDAFPEADLGETLVVPTPAEGGDGRAING